MHSLKNFNNAVGWKGPFLLKTRIFIDYWNFQLSLSRCVNDPTYRSDWKKIPDWLFKETQNIVTTPLQYEGTKVFMSYDPRKEEDKNFLNWAHTFLDRLPGVSISMYERKPKRALVCPRCHKTIVECPHCHGATDGTVEKGVDSAIVTELLSLAWENAWGVAILVTSDRDFIPAVQLLNRKGFCVINAHFPPNGADLSRTCWASIDMERAIPDIKRSL